jgi:hypothetical protein
MPHLYDLNPNLRPGKAAAPKKEAIPKAEPKKRGRPKGSKNKK